jgi:S1-C subfamily serine protease
VISKIKKCISTGLKVAAGVAIILGLTIQFSDIQHNFIRSKVGSEVVSIIDPSQGGGTGFHIQGKSGQTYIMTNVHICEMSTDGKPLLVTQEGLDEYVPRKVIFMSKKHDICLMEPLPGHTGIKLASSVDIGEEITVVGHPHLRPLTLSKGEVIDNQAITTIPKFAILTQDDLDYCKELNNSEVVTVASFFGQLDICVVKDITLQISAIAYPGNSGSPVVNKFGNVIGLLFAGNSQAVNDAYLVKLEHLKEVLDLY